MLWKKLDQLYLGTWVKANGGLGSSSFKYALELLGHKTPEDIRAGIEKIEQGGSEFKPTLPELVKLCRATSKNPSHKTLGVDFELPALKKHRSVEQSNVLADLRERLKNKNRTFIP